MGETEFKNVIGRIRGKFLVRLARQYERSQDLAQDWPRREGSFESLEELCEIAHKVAGLAKSVGFSDLGLAAFVADSTIRKWLGEQNAEVSEADVTAVIDEFLAGCSRALDSDREIDPSRS